MRELAPRQVKINDPHWSPRTAVNEMNLSLIYYGCVSIRQGKRVQIIPYFLWANYGESQMKRWMK